MIVKITKDITTDNYLHTDIKELVIKAFYNVYNNLSYGFLEKVYEKSLLIELKKINLNVYHNYRYIYFIMVKKSVIIM